jgi:hypothetical protein
MNFELFSLFIDTSFAIAICIIGSLAAPRI